MQVHLTVDTTLQDNKLAINVYMARVLSLGGKPLATEFQAVDHEILSADLERLGKLICSALQSIWRLS